jgi:hypothetical protein
MRRWSSGIGLHVGDRQITVARCQDDDNLSVTTHPALMSLVPAGALLGTLWEERGAPYSGEMLLYGNAAREACRLEVVRERLQPCGRLDLHRPVAEFALHQILQEAVGSARFAAQVCVIAIPGSAIGQAREPLFHAMILQDVVRQLGYSVTALEEGRAVVLADKADAEPNLLGFSCDQRLIQASLSCRGIVGVSFSMEPGAGWVDDQVAMALEVPIDEARKVRLTCQSVLVPKSRPEEAFFIYSRKFVQRTWQKLAALLEAQGTPIFGRELDAVWAGPWRAPEDFGQLVLREAKETGFPVPLHSVRYAPEAGKTAVARGCLEMARMLDADVTGGSGPPPPAPRKPDAGE